ncbi:hypothetical protein PTTG_10847, partial [Puccinia triticina 1-1 BBBD Race 1]
MDGISLPSSGSDTNLAPPPKSGFEELESALPPLGEDFLALPEGETLPPDTGIPPALYNQRETSLALASACSTPVPRPIEREQMNQAPPQQISHPTNPEGLRPGTPHDLALLPPSQNQGPPVDSSAPMEVIPEETEVGSLVNLFNNQFELFVCSR